MQINTVYQQNCFESKYALDDGFPLIYNTKSTVKEKELGNILH
jgi:hypothetical protein